MTLSCPGYVRENSGNFFDKYLSLPRIGRSSSSETEGPSAQHKDSDPTSPGRKTRRPYTTILVRDGDKDVGSSYNIREPRDGDKFRHRLAKAFVASATKTDQKPASSPVSNASAQTPTCTGESSSSPAVRLVKDIPKVDSGVFKRSRSLSSQSPGVGKQGAVVSSRSLNMLKREVGEDDSLWCRFCGQSSRALEFIERALTFRKTAHRHVRPTHGLTPMRCKTCYSFFPVSPQARPEADRPADHEQETASPRGRTVRILASKRKPSVMARTYSFISEEVRSKEEQDENKKKERGNLQLVDRDVLLLRLHMRTLSLNSTKGKGTEKCNPGQSPSKSRAEESPRATESKLKIKAIKDSEVDKLSARVNSTGCSKTLLARPCDTLRVELLRRK